MIFNKLFGMNENFEPGSKTSIIDDSIAIRKSVDYPLILAAWDEYVEIKRRDPDYKYGDSTRTPVWEALKKVEEYKGNLKKFKSEEWHLLRAMKKGFFIYADVLHVLIDHHDDVDAAKSLFDRRPEIHKYLPQEYDNPHNVIEVLIEVVRDYQWQLEQFSSKHMAQIEKALATHKKYP